MGHSSNHYYPRWKIVKYLVCYQIEKLMLMLLTFSKNMVTTFSNFIGFHWFVLIFALVTQYTLCSRRFFKACCFYKKFTPKRGIESPIQKRAKNPCQEELHITLKFTCVRVNFHSFRLIFTVLEWITIQFKHKWNWANNTKNTIKHIKYKIQVVIRNHDEMTSEKQNKTKTKTSKKQTNHFS